MRPCRVCDTPIEPFMSFGPMPIANRFLNPAEAGPKEDDIVFELQPCVCPNCGMFQLYETPDATELFHGDYAYYASLNAPMVQHFKGFAEQVRDHWVQGLDDPFIVEVGSNDGIMLQNFHGWGLRHLGIEPSGNVAAVARDKGMSVRVSYFNEETATEVIADQGKANVILGANVIAHIADFNAVAKGIRALLDDKGVFIFENAYLGDIVPKTSFDQLYDEHVFTFGAYAVKNAFARHGLQLVRLEHQDVHCGSMRYTIAHDDAYPVEDSVHEQLAWESAQKMDQAEGYDNFRDRCQVIRDTLADFVQSTKADGKTIAGFGATAKSTTTMNYCGLTSDQLDFIQDSTPAKIGKLTPGTRIPIQSPDYWANNYPDYAINFAWNYRDSIEAAQKAYTDQGGHWVYYIPELEIV